MSKGGEKQIKTRLALEGEREYREACRGINLGLKEVGAEMRLVSAEFGANTHSVAALKRQNDILSKQYAEQANRVKAAEDALRKMREGGVDPSSEAYRKMQINLTNATAELVKTEQRIKSNTEEMRKNAVNWDKVGEAAAKAGVAIAKAAAAFGAAALGAGTAMAAMAVSAAAFADDLLTQSSITHIATDSLQKYGYALNFIDGDMETLTKTIRKNVQNMDLARNGNDKLSEAYARLGVSVTGADGALRDGETVYWEVVDALGKIENLTERDALAMQILGKSATEMNPVIDAGSAAFKALGEEAEQLGVVMSGESLSALGAFDDRLQQLKAGFGGLKNATGLIAMPFLDALASQGIPIIAEFSKSIQNANGDLGLIGTALGEGLAGIVDMLVDSVPELIDLGVGMLEAIVEGIVDNADEIGTAAAMIVETLLSSLVGMLPMLIDGAVRLVAGLAQGLAQSLPTLVPQAVGMLTTVVNTLLANIPLLVDAALQLLTGFTRGLIDAIPVLIEAIPQIITGMIEAFLLSHQMFIQTGIELLTALVDALPDIIDAIVDVIPQIITGIIDTITGNMDGMIQTGVKLFVSLIDALPRIILTIVEALPELIIGIVDGLLANIDKLIEAGVMLFVALIQNLPIIIIKICEAVPKIVQGIVDAFGRLSGKIVEIGTNLLTGIWQGISGGASWLWDKVSEWAQGLIDGVLGFFGIHSPSRVFAKIGGNLVLGLGVGFENEASGVANRMMKATRSISSSVIDELGALGESELAVSASVKAKGRDAAQLGGVNVVQHIYARDTSYVGQQREAARQMERLVREAIA